MREARAGFSLLEMVVAGTILAILVAALGPVTVQAARVGRAVEERALRAQVTNLARELLAHDLARAGYGGADGGTGDLGGPAMEIEVGAGSGGDVVTARFIEDTVSGPAGVRVLTFSVSRDTNRIWNLYLREGDATRQPALQHVRRMTVTGILVGNGEARLPVEALPRMAAGIEIALDFAWGESMSVRVVFPLARLVSKGAG